MKVNPQNLPTETFEWGAIKWFVSPEHTAKPNVTFGEVILLPGKGHDRHNHPDSEEILYVLSGEGKQMVNDEEAFTVCAGDTIYIPAGVFHSTYNTGWEPLRLLAFYNPGGAEALLRELPDFRKLEKNEILELVRKMK
ncbi:cupin domain-containing protein [Paenibacillus medicaginis]|uniref:Cupin domain-containing protein n=1 Tax=Paenibacillus medicaginis TaxID=1470560 RepID=A0ABV5C3T4_9BACL